MFVRCRTIAHGPGPGEIIIEITTKDDVEEVVVHPGLVKNNGLDVGSVLTIQNGLSLVELPRESTSGKWRIWVPETEVLEAA